MNKQVQVGGREVEREWAAFVFLDVRPQRKKRGARRLM